MNKNDEIMIIGARENNLKNISLNIPKGKFVVLTGVSGSGKSSIAFATLQKECQRRYLESLGLGSEHIGRPMVDKIVGLSPSISVCQYTYNGSPRSTVGTLTELYTYLRLLFSRLGQRLCPHCGGSINSYLQRNLEEDNSFADAGEALDASDDLSSEDFQEKIKCEKCDSLLEPLTMAHFSFNTIQGVCPICKGLGAVSQLDISKVIHEELSISEGAVDAWGKGDIKLYGNAITKASKYYGFPFSVHMPVKELVPAAREILYHGVYSPKLKEMFPDKEPPSNITLGRFLGVVYLLENRLNGFIAENKQSEQVHKYMIKEICPECEGSKLKRESLNVTINGFNIYEVSNMSLQELKKWILDLKELLGGETRQAVEGILAQFTEKVENLIRAGVSYLCLSRPSSTLSAGEVQRIRLASLLGSELTGVLYVLDEPTVGLHRKNKKNLIEMMKRLCDGGNTVLVVEHDMDVMRAADYIIDIGPGAGKKGGQLVYAGDYNGILSCAESVTGKCLRGNTKLDTRKSYRKGNGKAINIIGAAEHNLKKIDVDFPLGMLVAVTGVAGAGKSSLVFDVLSKAADIQFHNGWNLSRRYEEIKGLDQIGSVITIDQSSIGRMVRSNVATYTDVFTPIRNHFASLDEAKRREVPSKFFSSNTQGGRCEKCQGMGTLVINMQYLPSSEVRCPVCRGKRYKRKVLEIKYKGYSISDVLNLTVEEALVLFRDVKSVYERLKLLDEVGLGYLILGQSATTLSGGEAQRIKIARELQKKKNHNTLYLLDEPTCGLHPSDTIKLMNIIQRLVDNGNSVIMTENNVAVIRSCDYVIDLGPDGGERGGEIVAVGTPDEIMMCEKSITGKALKELC